MNGAIIGVFLVIIAYLVMMLAIGFIYSKDILETKSPVCAAAMQGNRHNRLKIYLFLLLIILIYLRVYFTFH